MKKYILPFTCLALTSSLGMAELFDCTVTPTSISCKKPGTTPTPTPPPYVPPAPAPSPTPTGCAPFYNVRALPNANTSSQHYGKGNEAYAYKLARPGNGGALSQGDMPETPTELTIEWALSPCAGDFSYYKTAAAAVTKMGSTFYPCGNVGGAAGGGIQWSANGSFGECRVPNDGRVWYINVRYVNGDKFPGCANTLSGCPVSMYFYVN